MLRTLAPQVYNASEPGKRLIFVGDIHGSFDPLVYVPTTKFLAGRYGLTTIRQTSDG